MRYVDTVTGDEFRGRTPRDVVLKMKDAAWLGLKGKGAYMREVADRCAQLSVEGSPLIDSRTPESFLASLVEANFLRKEK